MLKKCLILALSLAAFSFAQDAYAPAPSDEYVGCSRSGNACREHQRSAQFGSDFLRVRAPDQHAFLVGPPGYSDNQLDD